MLSTFVLTYTLSHECFCLCSVFQSLIAGPVLYDDTWIGVILLLYALGLLSECVLVLWFHAVSLNSRASQNSCTWTDIWRSDLCSAQMASARVIRFVGAILALSLVFSCLE